MDFKTLKINYEDERGIIMDIISDTDFQHATIITSNKGTIRADHYHKKTSQYTFILNGKFIYISRDRNTKKVGIITLNKNDLVLSPPNEDHLLYAQEDSTMLVLTCGIRGGEDYEKDTFRLNKHESLKKYINNN